MNEYLQSLLAKWPKAVESYLICNESDEAQKEERGRNIVELFLRNKLQNKKFLDFGCGEGHTILPASTTALTAVGYDIKKQWAEENPRFFTDFEEVKKLGKFDVILLYDVLDHTANMSDCLSQVKELCHSSTIVHVLTHPWCGRHGGHLYQQFNYAFAHVVFTDEELAELGVKNDDSILKIVNPIAKYKEAIVAAGFKLKHHEVIKEPVEKFFRDKMLAERIISSFKKINIKFNDFPEFQLEQSHHEFELTIS